MKKHSSIEQGTSEWHQIRKGKITGTMLKDLMGTPKKREDAIYELIAERLTVGVEEEYENPMDRGVRLEPEAIAAFELKTGKKVERVGFCEDDSNTAICNSPDGLITGEASAVEVKCMGGKNHVRFWITDKVPEEYYWQTVQYFVVNEELEKLYFVGYNPDIPVRSMHIIEITRAGLGDDIERARQVEESFLIEVNGKLKDIITL